jgi:hypothetical protein
MPPSWTSAALSTISPTSNFDIENSPGIIEVRNDYFPLTLSPPYQPDREALRPRHPRTDVSGECESEQARAKQNETGNRHGKETVGSEFIAHHGPPPNRSGTLITEL